ncbi:hypothetical protein NQ318_002419 [Aromia moschata]|uniref:H/ACA ribonucleoprotein complex subunit n=1 Tax=Aromia moschata TaxID=1265417 RepID=A0AAV8YHQ6_9CUCU|nr:hypothetical protein NQ318_002419 [Aromia moschata]
MFRGRGGGGGRNFGGGSRGGGRNSFGGGRGGRGGGGRNFDQGPPEQVIPLGYFDYSVQDDLVCKVEIEDVPYFNAPIYLENKEQIGKIDEIFGNIKDYSVTIRLGEDMKASSFKKSQKPSYFLCKGFYRGRQALCRRGAAEEPAAVEGAEEEVVVTGVVLAEEGTEVASEEEVEVVEAALEAVEGADLVEDEGEEEEEEEEEGGGGFNRSSGGGYNRNSGGGGKW